MHVCVLYITSQLPGAYIFSTVVVAGNNVTDSMMLFGDFLRTLFKKDESYRKSDFTINYLGSVAGPTATVSSCTCAVIGEQCEPI